MSHPFCDSPFAFWWGLFNLIYHIHKLRDKSCLFRLVCEILAILREQLTGLPVKLTIKPAEPNTGLKFRRIDLPDKPFIDASAAKVQTVERATTLAEGSVKVHTVEHILSALTGMGVDNAIIEMDSNEPPIGDGSASPYVKLIKQAGIEEQDAPCHVWEIREPIQVVTK